MVMRFRILTTAIISGGGTNHLNRDKILKLQKHAARMIFDDYDTPSKELSSKLNWLPVDNRIAHST